MADLAIGKNCPFDGTLTACAGVKSDSVLVGTCACCGRSVKVRNHFLDGLADVTPAEVAEVLVMPPETLAAPAGVTSARIAGHDDAVLDDESPESEEYDGNE